jgi:predicted LPLAT superfamily acyltransferase
MSTPAPRTAAGWTAERERSNLWALRLMRWIAITAGRPRARLVLHPIALYFLLVHGRARRASLNYLVRVLGRPVGWRDAYRHIHHFAATILDRVYFLQDQFDRFEVSATGAAALHAPLDRGEGVMLVGAHLGSFEALRASAQGRGARVAMLMYEDNARLLNATLAAVAPHAELHTIGLGRAGAMLTLRRWLDDGGIAGLLADRTLPGHARGIAGPPQDAAAPLGGGRREAAAGGPRSGSRTLWLDFLGQPARFSDGPFRLAAMLRRQVVFMAGLYHGGDRYELRFVELADFRAPAPGPADRGTGAADPRIAEAMQRYVTLLESLCRETPYNWFNFFDFWSADDAAAPASP